MFVPNILIKKLSPFETILQKNFLFLSLSNNLKIKSERKDAKLCNIISIERRSFLLLRTNDDLVRCLTISTVSDLTKKEINGIIKKNLKYNITFNIARLKRKRPF